jgi:hypothetical protein
MFLQRLHRWLNGTFVCRECGKKFYTMFFGYGEAICPECYQGERQFIFFDTNYWLNRISAKVLEQRVIRSEESYKSTRTYPIQLKSEIEVETNAN